MVTALMEKSHFTKLVAFFGLFMQCIEKKNQACRNRDLFTLSKRFKKMLFYKHRQNMVFIVQELIDCGFPL